MSNHRVNKLDYADGAVLEAFANTLMHRDCSVIDSKIHVICLMTIWYADSEM